MKKYYAKQVCPEWTEDPLFYEYKDKRTDRYAISMNDEAYTEDIIINGNKDFHSYYPEKLEDLEKHLDEFNSDLQGYYGYHESITELANSYFKKHNGKRWSKIELSQWRKVSELTDNYSRNNEEEAMLLALKLITGKTWRKFCIRGNSQSDWQYGYASEIITDKGINYIGMCYFNTGSEFIVYECKKDFNNEENGCSYYVDSYKELHEQIGCKENQLVIYEFDYYKKIPQYKLA